MADGLLMMAESFFRLYLVTDRQRTAGRPLLDVVDAALQGGVDAVQLREKDLCGGALFELAIRLRELTQRYGARLLVNERIDVALAVAADGVHLPVDSFTPVDARRLLGPKALIGASTHSIEQARAAAAGGADFIVFGPVFETPSKRAFGAPVGLDALAEVTHAVTPPVLAIGGLTTARAASTLQRGAHGVAVVAAILEADDPRMAAAALRAELP
jgi:thiamine-phosphate pyrophosphorylase